MMQLGVDGVFVGSGIFKSEDPAPRAAAVVQKAVTHYQDAKIIAEVSRGLGEPMRGLKIGSIPERSCWRCGASRVPKRVGVLALQGDFLEHRQTLEALGHEVVEGPPAGRPRGPRRPGHSRRRARRSGKTDGQYGLLGPLRGRIAAGLPTFGTCAGAIVLARDIGLGISR